MATAEVVAAVRVEEAVVAGRVAARVAVVREAAATAEGDGGGGDGGGFGGGEVVRRGWRHRRRWR